MCRMRRSLAWFAALAGFAVLPSALCFAETRLGPIAGLNAANLDIEGQSDLSPRYTLAIGAAIDIGVGTQFGVRMEPMFISKGCKAPGWNRAWVSIDGAEFHLDYLNLAVLGRYDFGSSGTHGYILGGLGAGVAIQQKVQLTTFFPGGEGSPYGPLTSTADFSDVFRSTDASVDFGAGIAFPIGTERLCVDGRVAIGLVDINQGGTVFYPPMGYAPGLGYPPIALTIPDTSIESLDFRVLVTYLFPWP